MTKELIEKAIDIKGKKYVLVSDRVLYFNENHKDGSIETELLSTPEHERVVVKATVSIGERKFTGHSQAVVGEGMVNKTAALENAETSAVGRALAMMGIGVIESIASADEMHKATRSPSKPPEKADGQVCNKCQAEALVSPKSGKYYCPEWKLHKEENEKYDIVSKSDEEFFDSLPEEN